MELLDWLKSNIIMLIGVVFFCGGMYVLYGMWGESSEHREDTEKKISAFFGKSSESEDKAGKKKNRFQFWKSDEYVEKEDNRPRTSVDDEMVGVITSNKIKLNEPIYEGASEINMRRGVATVAPGETLDEHTVAIAGHRSQVRYKYFSEILKLVNGDEVTVITKGTNGEQVVTVYEVVKTYKVKPEQTGILEEKTGEPRTLLLITCDQWNAETKVYDERWVTEAQIKG